MELSYIPPKIKFKHFIKARLTVCEVGDSVGVAVCSPRDNFSRNVGRKVALTKALQSSHFTKYDRTKVWEEYFSMCPNK